MSEIILQIMFNFLELVHVKYVGNTPLRFLSVSPSLFLSEKEIVLLNIKIFGIFKVDFKFDSIIFREDTWHDITLKKCIQCFIVQNTERQSC